MMLQSSAAQKGILSFFSPKSKRQPSEEEYLSDEFSSPNKGDEPSSKRSKTIKTYSRKKTDGENSSSPLTNTGVNRSSFKPAVSDFQFSLKSATFNEKKPVKSKTPERKSSKKYEQLYLDLGQKSWGHITCPKCGMCYNPGKPEDDEAHAKHHRFVTDSSKFLDFPGWKNERVVKEYSTEGSRIIMVRDDDLIQHSKKVAKIKAVMDAELGYVEPDNANTENETVFLFVNSKKKAVGCLVAEPIKCAHQVISYKKTNSSKINPANQSSSEPEESDEDSGTISCSPITQPAVVGVSRIWVHDNERRKGIASRLMDTLRYNFTFGTTIAKDECAFTQPTPDGKQFFAKYTETDNFLVYQKKCT